MPDYPDYPDSANIYVTNNTGGIATILLSHRYSDDPAREATWPDVPSGETTPTPLVAGYKPSLLHWDYWWIEVKVHDGPHAGDFASDGSAENPKTECTLKSEDNGQNLYFTVDTEIFVMKKTSGECSTDMKLVLQ